MTDRYTKAVLTVVAAAAVAIAVKQIAAPVSGTMPPPQTNPAPQTSPPAPGPAYPPSHPVIGAPRAFGQVVTSQPEGSHVILSKNVVSVLHPSPGAFCIVLTPEILAYEAVMVATLRLPLIYLPRYSISHIETKSDTWTDCGNANAILVLTWDGTYACGGTISDRFPCYFLASLQDHDFTFIVP